MVQGRRCLKHRQSNSLPRKRYQTKTTVTAAAGKLQHPERQKSPSRWHTSPYTRRRKIRAESSLHLQTKMCISHTQSGWFQSSRTRLLRTVLQTHSFGNLYSANPLLFMVSLFLAHPDFLLSTMEEKYPMVT